MSIYMKEIIEALFGKEEQMSDMEARELNRMELEIEKARIENALKF